MPDCHQQRGLCADGYLTVEETIPVDQDFTTTIDVARDGKITDPAPFNHSTKIAVLRVRRKDGRR
jgi:23S rRNA (cytosine1962-C5)-methyltransferase